MEWSEEKFLKGIVGDKTRLRVWNKHQKIELVFTQLARYHWMHGRVLKCQKTIPEKLANKQNESRHKVDIQLLLLARIYSLPAAWANDLSFETWSEAFGDPHYISRPSPETRPILMKRDLYWWKETHIDENWNLFQKLYLVTHTTFQDLLLKRDPYWWKETYIDENNIDENWNLFQKLHLVTHTTFQDLLLKRDPYWWKDTYIDEKRPILMKIETCFRSFIWWPTLPFKTFFSLYSLGMKFSDLKFWVQENTFSTKKSLKFVSCRGLDPWCEVRQNIYVKMYVTYIYMHKYNIGHNIYIHVYIDFCTYMYP